MYGPDEKADDRQGEDGVRHEAVAGNSAPHETRVISLTTPIAGRS